MKKNRFVLLFTALRSFLKDKNTAKWPKLLLVAAVIYLVVPFDLVSDFLPLVGLLDDAGVVTAVIAALLAALKKARPKNV